LQIKRLGINDKELANQIIAKYFPEGELNSAFLENYNNYLLVAYIDNDFAGFLYGYEQQRLERKTPMMFLYSIDVLEKYHRLGVGKALINTLKSICTENKFMKMFVITNKSNTAAIKLYQSTGGIEQTDDDTLFSYSIHSK